VGGQSLWQILRGPIPRALKKREHNCEKAFAAVKSTNRGFKVVRKMPSNQTENEGGGDLAMGAA